MHLLQSLSASVTHPEALSKPESVCVLTRSKGEKQQDHRHLHWSKVLLACSNEAGQPLASTLQNEGRSLMMEQVPRGKRLTRKVDTFTLSS